jgi:hypothetical protein
MKTPMIVTVYGADGTKVRTVSGIPGGGCLKAAEPYEANDIPGQTTKFSTSEMNEGNCKLTEQQTVTEGEG